MSLAATLEAWIAEAEIALHNLNMGKRVVSINHDNFSAEYAQSDSKVLQTYIASLKAQLNKANGISRQSVSLIR